MDTIAKSAHRGISFLKKVFSTKYITSICNSCTSIHGHRIKAIYTVYTMIVLHKVHKKRAYRIEKSLFFLRPFYVFSTSFLRNGYMEVSRLHKVYIFVRIICICKE